MKVKFLKLILLFVFVLDLYFIYTGFSDARFFTKTLLLPLLCLIYVLKAVKLDRMFLSGFVFSFFGDFFLLFSWGFLPGLASFLLAHIFYILSFRKMSAARFNPLIVTVVSIYLFGLLYYLFPYLNEMKIPVVLYGITIAAMLVYGFRSGRKLIICGALFFIISDSILAVNLFVNSSLLLSLTVMITYVVAQFLLVEGMTEKENNIQNI